MIDPNIIITTLILGGAGFLVMNIKSIFNFISEFILNFFFHSVIIDESSTFFYAVQNYVMREKPSKVKNYYYRNIYDNFITGGNNDDEDYDMFYNYGYFFIRHAHGFVFFSKLNEKISNTMTPYKNTKQSIKIFSFSKKPLDSIIKHINDNYVNNKIYYYFNNDGEIKLLNKVTSKNFNNIFLNDNLIEKIKKDLDLFESGKEKYKNLGIKYKRTYLFHGPAGTGKSSLASAISNYTKRNILSINLSKDMTDSTLIKLVANRPKRSIILYEDIDCLFDNISREEKEISDTKKKDNVKITLSCILNILDGSYTPEDVIFIMTTNHIDKLDEALKRDGRTDMLIEITKPNIETKKKYLDYIRKNSNFDGEFDVYGDITLSTLEKELLK